jgi:hypothetical protein
MNTLSPRSIDPPENEGEPIIAPDYHCAPLADRDEDKLAIISRRPPLGLLDGTRPFP